MTEQFSPEVKKAADQALQNDPNALRIAELTQEIEITENKVIDLKGELYKLKEKRPEVIIKYRESIRWCLDVDARNSKFFLKTAQGVYNCIAFKHKIDIDSKTKSKISTTLSMMHKEGLIGRLYHEGKNAHYYGLASFFEKDLVTLKKKYEKDFEELIK
jgi:hypothetical protein